MKKIFVYTALAMALILCACGSAQDNQPAADESPVLTDYVLSDESAEEILALADIPELRSVDGGSSREYDALLKLRGLRPDCSISWKYEFGGTQYPSDAKELKAVELSGLEEALLYLPELEYVDLIDSPAVLEDLDRYSEIRPDIFYYWAFEFNHATIRTDIKCFSTLRTGENHAFTSEELYPVLKYCKKLRALDLGHNDLTDISLIGELKDLEILILADNKNLVDASPLAKLDKLIYLEFFLNRKVEDFSFLYSLNNMKDLNLCYCKYLTSIDFLENMPDINFLLAKFTDLDRDEFIVWRDSLPDATLIRFDRDEQACGSSWRNTERNRTIRYNFSHWRNIFEYNSYDDVVIDLENFNY